LRLKDGFAGGAFAVTLTLLTDQYAVTGASGQSFSYSFTGSAPLAVDEPASGGLIAAGLAWLGWSRRRRVTARQPQQAG
jgi:hypothetical protein